MTIRQAEDLKERRPKHLRNWRPCWRSVYDFGCAYREYSVCRSDAVIEGYQKVRLDGRLIQRSLDSSEMRSQLLTRSQAFRRTADVWDLQQFVSTSLSPAGQIAAWLRDRP